MKKLKKFLAGVVTLAMAMSMMTMTAFATETGKTNSYDGQTLSTSTIDQDATGKLTIHKYEGDEIGTGTGAASDANDISSDPEDANYRAPLDGVEFTVYEVMNKEQMLAYYNGESTDTISLGTYVTEPANGAKVWTLTDEGKKLTTTYTMTTANGGVATQALPLGIYLVVETKPTSAVTKTVKPFFVSIPMTTVEGDKWLYDVEVFPKNETAYAGVELVKYGITGGDVDSKGVLPGVTFKLFKLTEGADETVDDSWFEITNAPKNGKDNQGDSLAEKLITDASGKIKIDGLTGGKYYFVEDSLPEDTGDGYILDQKTRYIFTVDGDKVTFPDGNTYGEDGKITVYNDKPDFDKEIQKRDGNWVSDNENEGGAADYSIGDLVPHQLTIDVPGNITELKTFKVTDVPTNLKDWVRNNGTTDTLKVTSESADGAAVATGAYSVSVDGTGFTITFTPANMSDYAGKKIVVTYKAELLSSAVTTTTGNPNEATLEYSNKILPDSSEEPPTDKIKDTTRVYTFEVQILKVDETGSHPLKGVKFDLYKLQGNDVAVTESPISDTDAIALGLPTGNGAKWVKVNTDSLSTDEQGKVSQKGLANGTYYLVETETNAGYNLLKAPVEVTLNVSYEVTTKQEWQVIDGIKTLVKHEVIEKTFDGKENATGVYETKVINKKGFELPQTGGMGTFVFTFVGVAMMAAAVILFLTSKKKEAK